MASRAVFGTALTTPRQGPAGEQGDPGAPGTDGRTILNGTGDPSPELGEDGDFYIDTSADELYGPKTSGDWGSGTSLVGPPGSPATISGADQHVVIKTGSSSLDTRPLVFSTHGAPRTVGGDPRGTDAVDFQTDRGEDDQVASGDRSGILCGRNNKSSGGESSIVAGDGNSVTGSRSSVLAGLEVTNPLDDTAMAQFLRSASTLSSGGGFGIGHALWVDATVRVHVDAAKSSVVFVQEADGGLVLDVPSGQDDLKHGLILLIVGYNKPFNLYAGEAVVIRGPNGDISEEIVGVKNTWLLLYGSTEAQFPAPWGTGYRWAVVASGGLPGWGGVS